MGQNLDALLKPGPRLSDEPPTFIEQVVEGTTLEERVAADAVERERLLEGPLYGFRVPIDSHTQWSRVPMHRTLEFQERQFRDGQRTAAIVWGSVLAAFILGAIFS